MHKLIFRSSSRLNKRINGYNLEDIDLMESGINSLQDNTIFTGKFCTITSYMWHLYGHLEFDDNTKLISRQLSPTLQLMFW